MKTEVIAKIIIHLNKGRALKMRRMMRHLFHKASGLLLRSNSIPMKKMNQKFD
jgi:hypothetical protein